MMFTCFFPLFNIIVPTAPPQNLSRRLQSPTGVVITWSPPVQQFRNGQITHYGIKFHKSSDGSVMEKNTTETRMVFRFVNFIFNYKKILLGYYLENMYICLQLCTDYFTGYRKIIG